MEVGRRASAILTAVVLTAFVLKGSATQVPSNTWSFTGSMGEARGGASAILLQDGRVLITGGIGANGLLSTTELYDPGTGVFSPAAPMFVARSNHVAVTLKDGRVLVAGGWTGAGSTSEAEVYDPTANTWSIANPMAASRSDATASLLNDGRVLIAGGSGSGSPGATLEIYSPLTGLFSIAGILSIPRSNHSAALLSDGRVLIAGGTDGSAALNSTEIFEPSTGYVTTGPTLNTPRSSHTATTLLNGSVLITGGSDGSSDLSSAEIYDPASGAFVAVGSMASARSGHRAFLLPGSNTVLIVGGTLPTAELFLPWFGSFTPTGLPPAWITGASGSALSVDGLLLMTGMGDPSAALYGFATIKTNQSDYSPGSIVRISGSGWQPGEVVTLVFREWPAIDSHPDLYAIADAAGNILNDQFVPDEKDANVRFYVTAFGSASQAQTSFTDTPKVGSVTVGAQTGSLTYGTAGSATYAITVNRGIGPGSAGAFLATLSVTTTLPAGATAVFSPNPVSFAPTDTSKVSTLTITTSGPPASTAAGVSAVSVRATLTAGDFAQDADNRTVTVSKATVTPHITVNSRQYNGTNVATIATRLLTDVVGTDDVSLAGGTATFADSNVGTGKTVTAVGLSLAGAGANNYQLSSTTAITTADITAANLTANITANDKVYDATTSATIASRSLTGTVSGDTVTLVAGTANFDTKNVGAGKTVTETGLSLTGADASKYRLPSTSATTTANITAASLTSQVTATNKVYDSTTTAAIATRTLTGVFGTDDVTLTGGTATFADKNVGTAKTVTVVALSLTGTGASNYKLPSTTATTTADITPATVTGSITANNKVYDGTTVATIASRSLSGTLGSDTVSLTGGTANFDTKNVGAGKNVTATGFTLAGDDAHNYGLSSTTATTTANITAATVTGSITVGDKVYDGTTAAVISTRSLGGVISPDDVSLSGGTATYADKNVGVGKAVTAVAFSLAGTDSGNYQLSSTSVTTTANITPATVTGGITANNKPYDATTAATIASRSLTGVLNSDAVNLTGGTANFDTKNPGVRKNVTATGMSLAGTDAGNYRLSSTAVSTTADITPAPLTSHVTATNKIYDTTTTATIASRTLMGVFGTEDVALIGGTGTFADKSVGVGKIVTVVGLSLTGADSGNYQLSSTTTTTTADITPLTVTGSITASNKVYDGTRVATIVTRSLTGVMAGDTVSVTGGTATYDTKNVGVGKTVTAVGLSLVGSDAGNYQLPSTTASTTADITPATVTGSITANNKAYDRTTAAAIASRSLKALFGTDDVSLGGGIATFTDANVGVGKTVTAVGLNLAGVDASNYELSSTTVTTTANITPAVLTGSITASDKMYDATTAAVILTRSSIGVISPDDVTITGGTATFLDKNVGVAKTVTASGLSLAGADAGNYQLSLTPVNTTANITPASLTGSITANNKPYDGTTLATLASRSLTGVLNSDVVSLTGGMANFDTKNVAVGKIVTATGLSLSGVDAGNYQLFSTTATTTADITLATVTPHVTATNKVYDTTTAVSIASRTLTGAVGTEDVTLSGGTATFADKNVGMGKTVAVIGLSLTGVDAFNYLLSSTTAITTADITPFTLTGNITASNKVYDGTTAATIVTRSLTGVLAGDTVSLTGGTATYDTKNVGAGKTVTAVGLGLAGTDAGNYQLSSTPTTTADITVALVGPHITVSNKVYDTTTAAAIVTRTLTGAAATDDIALAGGTATFDTRNAGVGKTVTATGLSLTGTDTGNYQLLTTTATTTANIIPATVTVSVTVSNKVFDGTTAATITSRSFSGILGTDVVNLTGGTATFSGADAGVGKTVTVVGLTLSGIDSVNYQLLSTTVTTTANIVPATTTGNVTVSPNIQQYSNRVTLVASLSSALIPGSSPATDVTFTIGTQVVGTAPLIASGGVLTATLANIQLLEPNPFGTAPTGQMAPGQHIVNALFGGVNPNFVVVNAATNLLITQEQARVSYNGAHLVSTSGSTSYKATIALAATIADITAVTPLNDTDSGDIRNAKVTFIDRNTNTPIATVNVGLLDAADTKVGVAVYNWDVTIRSCPSSCWQTYTVGTIVSNYYTRNNSADDAVITVAQPEDYSMNGNGALVLTSSAGLKAGDSGSPADFHFNTGHNGTGLQGNFTMTVRRTEGGVLHVYEIAGTSVSSVLVNGIGHQGTMTGEVAVHDITNPEIPISVDDHATLIMTATDGGDPGSNDSIGITVVNKNGGMWFSNNFSANRTVEQKLANGNVSVP